MNLSQDALITGATGFVGRALVSALLRRGAPAERLRCLVRDRQRALQVGIPPAAIHVGDVADPASLLVPARGVGLVFHLAGTLKASGSSGFRAVNIDGTANLVAAVQAAAPAARFVLVSSLAAAGPSVDGRGSDLPPDRCLPVSAYGDSKRRGELAVVASPLAWVIVRPPAVYGSGDEATRLLFRQACGVVAPVPRRPAPMSIVAIDDLVQALLLAPSACGRRLIVPIDGRDRTDMHALVRAIAVACGRRARLLPVPLLFAGAAAVLSDAIARLRGTSSYFNRDKVREISAVGWVADGSIAARELGFVPATPLADGLAAVAASEGLRAVTSGAA